MNASAGKSTNRVYRVAVVPGDGIGKEVVPEGVRVLEADQAQQVPGSVWQHGAVDFGIVLHGDEHVVEGFVGPTGSQGGERPLGTDHVLAAHFFAQR